MENRTLKLHWSIDVPYNHRQQLTGIIAGPNDDLVVIVNRATYAVVALFGFGIGVYDVNAIESNDRPIDPRNLQPDAERDRGADQRQRRRRLRSAAVHQCDQASLAPDGFPCAVNDLTYSPMRSCAAARERRIRRCSRWNSIAASTKGA